MAEVSKRVPAAQVEPPPRRHATTVVEDSKTPVRKVLAATGGAGIGGVTADLVIGGLADVFNNGHPLPLYLSGWLVVVVPAACALAAGYYTKRAVDEG